MAGSGQHTLQYLFIDYIESHSGEDPVIITCITQTLGHLEHLKIRIFKDLKNNNFIQGLDSKNFAAD